MCHGLLNGNGRYVIRLRMVLGVNASCIVLAPAKHASQGPLQTFATANSESADESYSSQYEPRWLALLRATYSTRASVPPSRCCTVDHTIKLPQQLVGAVCHLGVNMEAASLRFSHLFRMRNAEDTHQHAPATSSEICKVTLLRPYDEGCRRYRGLMPSQIHLGLRMTVIPHHHITAVDELTVQPRAMSRSAWPMSPLRGVWGSGCSDHLHFELFSSRHSPKPIMKYILPIKTTS
ncbi:hypothetical protein BDW60DRAFT_155274 [Aspergillus nidulans var. acristatus]